MSKSKQIKEIISNAEKEMNKFNDRLVTKDKPLNADVLKTIRAQAYEKIKKVVKEG